MVAMVRCEQGQTEILKIRNGAMHAGRSEKKNYEEENIEVACLCGDT
jgi:hypothetical protein